MKPGSVHLIGAGPGDPALITVRGQRLLRSADVVVHDHEVHHRLLESVRPEAERIDTAALATRSGNPPAVGLLLAEKAAAGLTVARLTAGDPLDAAAGEAAALRAADVAFTVVPGIPRLPNELTCAGPLSGKRILVTRPREQAADLLDRLLDLGAEPVEAPTIRIAPPDDYGPLDAACAAAGSFDWIVFTSVNGVDAFMRRLLDGPRDVRALGGVKLCAIGPATAARLQRHGLKADVMPDEHRAEAVFDALKRAGALSGARVLLARADIARAMLADALRNAGAAVTEATAYRTVLADGWTAPELLDRLRARPVDVATFTSASTVRNFVEIVGAGPAIRAVGDHHGEEGWKSVEAFLVAAADAISGARPGARRESAQQYIKRLETLEQIALGFDGVDRAYAIQAGREVRVMVQPDNVDDTAAMRMARDMTKKIQDSMEYPGQIKVMVIRETRAVEYAR